LLKQVMRRVVSYVRSRYGAINAERSLDLCAERINKMCSNLRNRKESEPLLLMQMFDVIFDFVASDVSGSSGAVSGGATLFGTAGPSSSSAPAGTADKTSTATNLMGEECKVTKTQTKLRFYPYFFFVCLCRTPTTCSF
jgi:hypothetical protein